MDELTGMAIGKARQMANRASAYADALEEANQNIRDQNLTIATLRRELAETRLEFLVKEAHAEGLKAQLDGMKAAHANTPMLMDSGRRYKDGDIKTKSRLSYEATFDRILRDARISDPTKYRAD